LPPKEKKNANLVAIKKDETVLGIRGNKVYGKG
jgi:hypothetical protein